ncbi:hypothetical protein U0070_020923 [Myodes glareolus]|uniref:Nucleophosmin n=1 Tax=Myodes glareolus TaxID=447135 RepID=A0AAW0IIH2_MYOGA
MSGQLTASPGNSEVTPPVVLRLKCGSGPVHRSGQHRGAAEEDAASEEEDEDDAELLNVSGKRSAPGGGDKVPEKKVKLEGDEDEDEDDEDERKKKKMMKMTRKLKKKFQ